MTVVYDVVTCSLIEIDNVSELLTAFTISVLMADAGGCKNLKSRHQKLASL
jgi:hypothetical protein